MIPASIMMVLFGTEKYLRLMSNQLCDGCLTRSSIRNLRRIVHGLDSEIDLQKVRREPIAPAPEGLIDGFSKEEAAHNFQQATRPLSLETNL